MESTDSGARSDYADINTPKPVTVQSSGPVAEGVRFSVWAA
jgi:hypothetical protein